MSVKLTTDRIKRSIVDWDRHGDNKLSRQPFDILISELPISYRVKADDSSTTKLTEKSKPTKLARNKWHQVRSYSLYHLGFITIISERLDPFRDPLRLDPF
jgi:hypothetical protein